MCFDGVKGIGIGEEGNRVIGKNKMRVDKDGLLVDRSHGLLKSNYGSDILLLPLLYWVEECHT